MISQHAIDLIFSVLHRRTADFALEQRMEIRRIAEIALFGDFRDRFLAVQQLQFYIIQLNPVDVMHKRPIWLTL